MLPEEFPGRPGQQLPKIWYKVDDYAEKAQCYYSKIEFYVSGVEQCAVQQHTKEVC